MEAMSIDFKNEALNLVVLLENATGAVFENEKLAIDIVEETLTALQLTCRV